MCLNECKKSKKALAAVYRNIRFSPQRPLKLRRIAVKPCGYVSGFNGYLTIIPGVANPDSFWNANCSIQGQNPGETGRRHYQFPKEEQK